MLQASNIARVFIYVIIVDIISISSHVGSASYISAVLLNTYFHPGILDLCHLYSTCIHYL